MAYQPTIHRDPGTVAGAFSQTPQGVILHGSRSGIPGRPVAAEYDGTRRYAASGIELGWNVTIGNDAISLHMQPDQWGWSARQHSKFYLAVEFAQATAAQTITDGQVRAFCWWIQTVVKPRWPYLSSAMPMHSELPAGITDGKTDCYPVGDPRANELRARILAGLAEEEEADMADCSAQDSQLGLIAGGLCDTLDAEIEALGEAATDGLRAVAATIRRVAKGEPA